MHSVIGTAFHPRTIVVLVSVGVVLCVVLVALNRSSRPYQTSLSRRYLFRRFSAFAAFLSIGFGVAVILIVLSIMGGYLAEFRKKLRGQVSDVVVESREYYGLTGAREIKTRLSGIDNVAATSTFVESLAMFRSLEQFNPCELIGIDIDRHLAVSDLGSYTLRPEELTDVLSRAERDADGAIATASSRQIIATELVDGLLRSPDRPPLSNEEFAQLFNVETRREVLRQHNHPEVFRELQRAPPQGVLVGAQLLFEGSLFLGQVLSVVTVKPGTTEHTDLQLVVVGAFKTGAFEADSQILYTNVQTLRNALELYDPETGARRYQGLKVAIADHSRFEETLDEIRSALAVHSPELRASAWYERRRTTMMAVEREMFVIYFLLVLLVAFTACMILLMLLLTVIEKTRDIGILLALGATPAGIVRVFLINGLTLTLAGTMAGLLGGYAFCRKINEIHAAFHGLTGIHLFPPEIYDMDRIPVRFDPSDVLLSVAPALLLGFLASLVPAVWASRHDPVKAIHQE